jgi:ParB family transcriptional regulator, chromosome partitioning protein
MAISKKDMAARAAKAGQMAPSIEDRLRHARDLASSHPADDLPAQPYSEILPQPELEPSPPALAAMPGARLEPIPLELIDPNPFNARKIYRTERVNELVASISAHGQEIPGVATPRDGRFVLAAGHYRLRALKLIGAKTMALMIRDGLSDRELYAHSYRENAEREAQSALDNALSWRELLDQGVYASETEIAEVTGMSLPNVNKTMAALRLSSTVLDFIKEDPKSFALSVLYELALFESVAGNTKALAMAKLVADNEAGRKEIQEARALLESPRERKRKETSRQYKIQRHGVQIGSLKEWDVSGKVTFEVVLSDGKERAALVEELRGRFDLKE